MTNSARKKNWLVLSYFSKIDGMACAQHIDDRIPYFTAQGIEPLMLTGVCGERWQELVQKRVASVSPSGLRFELRHLKKKGGMVSLLAALLNLLILPLYLLEKLFIDLDSQWSWFPLAILSGEMMCRRYQPELIYSTGGPASAHLAAALIARRHNIPWIAEFQDPLVHEDWLRSKRALKVFTWLERLICTRADAVIFLTDGARERADRRTGLGSHGWTIYPGSNPTAMPEVAYQKGEFCHFAHFGSLGGSRNLKVFLEALGNLLAERPALADSIRLDVFGTCDRLSRSLIDEFPAQGVVRCHGRISRSDSLVAMKRCDVLLLIQNTEEFSSETIPSKTYEYLHVGRPILGLVHNNPELERMLTDLGHRTVAADQAAVVQRGIMACFDQWTADEAPSSMSEFSYTVQAAVTALCSIAEPFSRARAGQDHG